jgi:hypothetical protein
MFVANDENDNKIIRWDIRYMKMLIKFLEQDSDQQLNFISKSGMFRFCLCGMIFCIHFAE